MLLSVFFKLLNRQILHLFSKNLFVIKKITDQVKTVFGVNLKPIYGALLANQIAFFWKIVQTLVMLE